MKEIKLTQNKIAIVDDETYNFLSQYVWHAHVYKHTSYAKTWVNGKHLSMQKLLLLNQLTDAKTIVDHIDGNGLNNQLINLRAASKRENTQNRSVNRLSTSGLKGVTLTSNKKLWRARIKMNGKEIFLGNFKNALDAQAAYDAKSRELFGEFAKTSSNKAGDLSL